MTHLGKCLLFYLKYPAEMARLFEAKEPKFDGLPNPDKLKQTIKMVGDAAGQEAAKFLETCAPIIEEHFNAISRFRRTRNKMNLDWHLEFRVTTRRAADRHFLIGVGFDTNRTTLIPWVWCRGGRRAADEIRQILGRGVSAEEFGWSSGTVALTEIKIPIPDRFDESAECESLTKQVREAFKSFTAQEVKALAAIETKLKASRTSRTP